MINIIKEDLTVSRFILIFIIICFITALLTIIYSSKLKDDLMKEPAQPLDLVMKTENALKPSVFSTNLTK